MVDQIQAEWASTYPELDSIPVGVFGRITHIATLIGHRIDRMLAAHDISRSELDILGALARAGRPLRASEVVSTTALSGASITKLSDALVRRGLLRRDRSARDGRVVLLVLTDEGRSLVDEVMPLRIAEEGRLLAELSDTDQARLVDLLRRVGALLSD